MQKILGKVRRAVTDYKMISEGDHIVVGVSGGKDSLLLLTALSNYRKFSPVNFKLTSVNINLGFKNTDEKEVIEFDNYIKSLDVELIRVDTDIAYILFENRKEKSPCSLCSKMRRGALNTKAIDIGAKKLALGHHSDDVLQTMFLSFLYEGRLSTFQPTAFMDRTGITLIRPFIYVTEDDIENLSKKLELPIIHNVCPANKETQREYMAELIEKLNNDIPGAKERMISALTHPERNNLWRPPD
ncbi:MAG: tRNA 2-thiocytidine biosynthesis TtcA family protein [Bacillota bacterium]